MAFVRSGLTVYLRPVSQATPAQLGDEDNTIHARRAALSAVWRHALLTTIALLAVIVPHVVASGYRVTDFIQIGRKFAAPLGITSLATSPVGYDGQYFYFMAAFPGQFPPGAFDFPALRYSRMLYPALIRLFSLGNVAAMPWVMLGINLVAIVATVALVGCLVTERGGRPWLALAAGLYAGQPLAMLRDLSDPLAIFWLALALFGVSRRRWLLAGAALGFGMLTRESTLLFVICFALPLCFERRWRLLALYTVLALGGYALWQGMLRACLGTWGWNESTHINVFLPVPFGGLASTPNPILGLQMFILACVPAIYVVAGGILLMARRPWHDALALAVATAAIAYGFALLLQPGIHWLDIWEPYRLAAPLAVLLPLLLTLLKPKPAQRKIGLFVLGLMLYSFLLPLLT
ncbi:MAG TPA: hypothetical protein VKQ30_06145 [Ktedonobacterales bacterium]|nr:hypothetical protein [Ktedonobacterales bacterium]